MEAIRGKIRMLFSGDGKLQMISGDGKFSSETASFVKDMENYTVISIIGPQSSGKSYLLNKLFKTKFEVLDAAKGRKQTTKGIWISKCIEPSVIIIDVEGCDGRERGEVDTSFEKKSALFALVVSDVLLLNMWFHDVGRWNGANLELIELIFQGRLKVPDATKTTIIILVRDYGYETPVENIKKKLLEEIEKIWEKVLQLSEKVDPPTKKTMDDYFEFIVWDFPVPKYEEQKFEQKCKSLSDHFYKFATKENLEQSEYSSRFAISSEKIWDDICRDEKIMPADQKVAKSKRSCGKIIKRILGSLDQEKGNFMSDLSIPVKKFAEEFSLIQKSILTRYDHEETTLIMTSVRNKKRFKLERELLHRLHNGFLARMRHLASKILSSARSNMRHELEKLDKLDNSAIEHVTKPYLKDIDDNTDTAAGLQRVAYEDAEHQNIRTKFLTELQNIWTKFCTELQNIRTKCLTELTKHAEEVANIIQVERSTFKCKKIKKEILDSFEQEKAHRVNDLSIPAKKFPAEFNEMWAEDMNRYDEETASCDIDVRNAEKAQLENTLLSWFQKGLDDRMKDLENIILSSAKSNIGLELKEHAKQDKNAIEEVIKTYLRRFTDNTPIGADLQWYPFEDYRVEFPIWKESFTYNLSTYLRKHAEEEAHNIQVDRYSTSEVERTIKMMLDSFDNNEANWMADLSINVKDFTAKFSLIHKNMLTRYEEETASFIFAARNKEKATLEKKLLDRFEKGLRDRMHHLASAILFSARSNMRPEVEKMLKLDNSAIEYVIKPYLKEFDDNTPTEADLKWVPYQDTELPNIRTKFVTDLRNHAEEEAKIIQDERSVLMCKKIKKEILDKFEQEQALWMNDLSNIPAKQFTKEFSILRKDILTRYEDETASFSSAMRNAEKAELEKRLLLRFSEGLYERMLYMTDDILFKARSNLASQLRQLKELDESSVTEVLNSNYLKPFNDQTPTAEDLKWYPNYDCLVELQKIRQKFGTDFKDVADRKLNNVKKIRNILNGLQFVGNIIISILSLVAPVLNTITSINQMNLN